MHPVIRLSLCWVPLVSIAAVMTLAVQPSRSQASPPCEPPSPDEYLLIVLNPTDDVQTQLRNALPGNATATVCTYLSDRVLRVDGFNSSDVADSWAQYISDASGLRAFVVRPAATSAAALEGGAIAPPSAPAIAPAAPPPDAPPATPAASSFPQPTSLSTPSPAPTPAPAASPTPPVAPPATPAPVATAPTAPSSTYNPQPLGAGYAVLVDYANRPEVAIELRQVLTRDVGLVAYGQRSYLLAAQTTDLAAANQVLQTLSDRNFTALIVDSQSAILLTPVVAKLGD